MAPKVKKPVYRAQVDELADTSTSFSDETSTVDEKVIDRIQKCLARANHPTANEAEAKTAMHMAKKLMEEHNLKQAEVLSRANAADRRQCAGLSTVSIRRTDGDMTKLKIVHYPYIDRLCHAIALFFDCKWCFWRKTCRIDIGFYGIDENTAAAAMAFEMVFNRSAHYALAEKGLRNRLSYLHGFSDALVAMAEEERREEEACEARAQAEEEQEPELAHGSNSHKTPSWPSQMALFTFRAQAEQVADAFAKEKRWKFDASNSPDDQKLDPKSFDRGTADGKTVDVRGQRIAGE